MKMQLKQNEFRITTRAPRRVSDGLCTSQDAYIELDTANMRSDFLQYFQHYYDQGAIRVRVARVERNKQ